MSFRQGQYGREEARAVSVKAEGALSAAVEASGNGRWSSPMFGGKCPVAEKVVEQEFTGAVTAVKARIRLCRSFDQIHHVYQGYTLVLDGTLNGEAVEELRIGVGPKAHEKHQFRIGDRVTGLAVPVPDPGEEWATHYKVSKLKVLERGPDIQGVPANPEGGIAPPLPEYRARGHRRLDKPTYSKRCQACPFGLVMATEITIDHWDPDRKKWRFETHCYGPWDCPRYRAGKPYRVQGRKPDMVWVDDDVEPEEAEREFWAGRE